MDQPKPQLLTLIDHKRAQKTQLEIFYIKQGADILAEVFERARKYIIPGMSELEVAYFIEKQMHGFGVREVAFTPIVASGHNAASIHHWPGARKIRDGDIIMIDFGAVVKGYCSDMTRTLFVGTPSTRQVRIYQNVLKAQMTGVKKVKPGVTGHQVDHAVRQVLRRAKLNSNFTHNLGHGIGQYVHEWPRLGQKSEDVLAPGMVVTVEPGVYIKKWGGIRIEDMVLVTNEGNEVLTRTPKDIDHMIIDTRFA